MTSAMQAASSQASFVKVAYKPFSSAVRRPGCCQRQRIVASATDGASTSRRDALQLGGLLGLSLALPQAAQAAKLPKGFQSIRDTQDGYAFLYPYGWQELTVDGQDILLKDVIEPLESVAVNLIDTEKASVKEFGEIDEVAFTMADTVLTGPKQPVKIVSTKERADATGRPYYEFEFLVDAGRYTRHQLATVAVGNGKFYTITTGCNERRWGKMKDKLGAVASSFEVFDRYNS